MESILLVVILFIFAWAFVYGGIKTFARNWLVAGLLVLFAFPLWVLWAFVEVFTGPATMYPLPVPVANRQSIDDL